MANRKVDMVPGKAVGFQNSPGPSAKNPKPIKGSTIKVSKQAKQKLPPVAKGERAQSTNAGQDMLNPTAKQSLVGGKKGHVQYK